VIIREDKNLRNKQPIILLIDGNALVHRAFHGMPELKTKKGQLVNAVYGFTSALLSSIREFDPKYIVVAWDVGKKTFRTEKFAQYKATRIKAPQELYDQFPLAKEVCKALNIPQFGIQNYEADDVIGTIASQISNNKYQITSVSARPSLDGNKSQQLNDQNIKFNQKANSQKLKAIIVTGDMDALQLVNDSVNVYSVARGIKKAVLYNKEKVQEKYGFNPNQLVDYKALKGDPSDNIPGVPGVGDKTAVNLIKTFGSIEKLYTYLDEKCQISNEKLQINSKPVCRQARFQISKRIKQLLQDNKEKAFLSKDLATICKDTPLDFRLSDAKVSDYNPKKVEKLFYEFEFKSLLKRLPQVHQITEKKPSFIHKINTISHQQNKLF